MSEVSSEEMGSALDSLDDDLFPDDGEALQSPDGEMTSVIEEMSSALDALDDDLFPDDGEALRHPPAG